jgi:hypothetical protein
VRFPEKGEARAAAEALDARLRAVAGDDIRDAEVNVCSGEMRGDETAVRGVYGDLFDVGDVAEFAEGPVHYFLADIAGGVMPDVALRSMFLLAVAQGVLMERARWAQ